MSTTLPQDRAASGPAPATSTRRGIVSWYLFDWATQPVATLITTFVFAPFFVDYIASAAGYSEAGAQSLWGWVIATASLIIAILSPILGSIADASGRRKPWVAIFSIPLVIGCALLWFTTPGESSAVTITLLGVFLAVLGAEFAQVFTNAMMPGLVPPIISAGSRARAGPSAISAASSA